MNGFYGILNYSPKDLYTVDKKTQQECLKRARILSRALRLHGRVAHMSWAAESKQRKSKQRSVLALVQSFTPLLGCLILLLDYCLYSGMCIMLQSVRGLREESRYYFPCEFVQNLDFSCCVYKLYVQQL